MKEVPLTKGKVALVDDEDFERVVTAGRWCMNGAYAYNTKLGTMHRFIVGLPIMRDRRVQVDHRNNDPLDNRKENLRVCSPSQNQQNRHAVRKGYSRFKGAHWDRTQQHWMSRIRINGKLKYLGVFRTDIEAARRYNEAAIECFGEFAHLNDLTNATPSTLVGKVKDPRKQRHVAGRRS